MFWVGQRVVCVDDSDTHDLGIRELVRGNVYVIAWVGMHEWLRSRNHYPTSGLGVNLADVRTDGVPFAAARFRPIQERKTESGMAILNSLLTPTPQKTPETV